MDREKRKLSVRDALEWAFRNECAQLDLPDNRPIEEQGFGFGTEYILLQRLKLGVQVDTFKGQSYPHEDAEVIAGILAVLSDPHRPRSRRDRTRELSSPRTNRQPLSQA